jgi:transposase
MGKIKKLELTDIQRVQLAKGFRSGTSHCLRMRCRAVLLKADGLSSVKAGELTDMSLVSVNTWMKRFLSEGITGLQTRPGRGRKPVMGCTDEEAVRAAIEQDRQSVSKARASWQEATGKEASDRRSSVFIRLGARYERIRKRPSGAPSPQLYDYRYGKLQELERQESEDLIALYYADESHICTEGYVPYG